MDPPVCQDPHIVDHLLEGQGCYIALFGASSLYLHSYSMAPSSSSSHPLPLCRSKIKNIAAMETA